MILTALLVTLHNTYSNTENLPKMLSEFGVCNGSRLQADDFLQNYQLVVNITHRYTHIRDIYGDIQMYNSYDLVQCRSFLVNFDH